MVAQGVPKGDASVAYVRTESVELATEILHGGHIRPNMPITVTKGQGGPVAVASREGRGSGSLIAVLWGDGLGSGL